MKNDKKRKQVKLLPNGSNQIEELTEEAINDLDGIEFAKKLFPIPTGNPFPIPFEPVEPAKWKQRE